MVFNFGDEGDHNTFVIFFIALTHASFRAEFKHIFWLLVGCTEFDDTLLVVENSDNAEERNWIFTTFLLDVW